MSYMHKIQLTFGQKHQFFCAIYYYYSTTSPNAANDYYFNIIHTGNTKSAQTFFNAPTLNKSQIQLKA